MLLRWSVNFNLTNKKLQAVWNLASQFVELKPHDKYEVQDLSSSSRHHLPPDPGQRSALALR